MDKIIIIGEESPDATCEYCGKVAELRPYGENGARICFDCGMKPENKAQTQSAFRGVLSGEALNPNVNQKN